MRQNDDLHKYRIGPLTLLQLMAVLALTGILVTWLLSYFFAVV